MRLIRLFGAISLLLLTGQAQQRPFFFATPGTVAGPTGPSSAVRFDSDGEYLYLSSGFPSDLNSWTWTGWFKYITDTEYNYYQTFFEIEQTGGGNPNWISATGALHTNPAVLCASPGDANLSVTCSAGTWYFVVLQRNGTTIYGDVRADGGTVSVTSRQTYETVSAMSFMRIDTTSSVGHGWLNGAVACVKMWDGVLTNNELQTEMVKCNAVKTSGLHGEWNLVSHTDLSDSSGNGYDLSSNGTLSTYTVDGPPITW